MTTPADPTRCRCTSGPIEPECGLGETHICGELGGHGGAHACGECGLRWYNPLDPGDADNAALLPAELAALLAADARK